MKIRLRRRFYGEIKIDFNGLSADVVSYSSSIDALSDVLKPTLSE